MKRTGLLALVLLLAILACANPTPTAVRLNQPSPPIQPASTSKGSDPTAVPAPTARPTTNGSAQAYREAMYAYLTSWSASCDETANLLVPAGHDPYWFGDSGWLSAMEEQVDIRAASCAAMRSLVPPASFVPVQTEILAACDDSARADSLMMYGVRNLDTDSLDEGRDYLLRAMDHLERAGALYPAGQ